MSSTLEHRIKAECFCSAEFGSGIQKELLKKFGSSEKLLEVSNVQHYMLKGDIVPHTHLFLKVTNVGKSTTLHSSLVGENSRVNLHDQFFKHILSSHADEVYTKM